MVRHLKLVSILLLGALSLALVAGCAAPTAQAQDPVTGERPRTITVSGTGTAYGSPDLATVQLGVQTRNTDPGQAVTENTDRMAALVAAIQNLGIPERDIQTTNFSVYAQQEYDPRTGMQLETITYVVDNTVSVTVRDIGRLGDVLSGAVDAGANSIYGVSFSVADKTGLENEARELAMNDARARAEALAQAAGVQLDTVLSISENFAPVQPLYYEGRDMAAGMGGAAAAVPVQTGQIAVDLLVSVTYTIR